MSEMTLIAARIFQPKAITFSVLLAWSLSAHALSLGKFQVQSAMGEPLRAEVEVTQFTPEELRGLQTQLASPSTFQQAGMEYNPALAGVVTRLESRSDGRPFIIMTGRNPIQDSFIDLILEAQWPTGRIVKNYALLLNAASAAPGLRSNLVSPAPSRSEGSSAPIGLSTNNPQQVNSFPSDRPSVNPSSVELNADQVPVYRFESADLSGSTSRPELPMAPAVTRPPVERALAMPASAPRNEFLVSNGDSLTVRSGDTASQLLAGRLPSNVSLDQMLLAMVRANPNAFIEANVNLVRAGSVLRVPKANEATQISKADARQAVIAQNRDFAAYARRVAESPLLVGSADSREMSGRVGVATSNSANPITSNDRLTLSKALTGKDNAEAKLASEREAKDAADQLAALNKNLQDLESLSKDRPSSTTSSISTSPLPTATNNSQQSLFEQMVAHKTAWTWVAGLLLGLLALAVWSRRKNTKSHEVFAPSYDDGPSQSMPTMGPAMPHPQMAGIDLNLNSSPANAAPTGASAIHDVTEQNKLALASQLLASGDKDLARTLIMSVASTANGDLKARALQMLGQIA
jgi:pilus assembly protein FimV